MKMLNRSYNLMTAEDNASGYRYGFNGKEQDFAWKQQDGTIYDYGFRIYDPNTGRFYSVDPLAKKYHWNSPYAFSENRVIDGIDLDGKEWKSSGKVLNVISGKYEIKYTVIIGVVNNSKLMTDAQIKGSLQNLGLLIESMLSPASGKGTFDDPIVTTTIDFTSMQNAQFKVIFFDSKSTSVGSAKLGNTQTNEIKVAATQMGKLRTLFSMARTIAHELGHTAGLFHIFDKENPVLDAKQMGPTYGLKDNLMNSDGNPVPSQKPPKNTNGEVLATDLTKGQVEQIETEVQNEQPK